MSIYRPKIRITIVNIMKPTNKLASIFLYMPHFRFYLTIRYRINPKYTIVLNE